MSTTNMNFIVKNGLNVAQNATIGGTLSANGGIVASNSAGINFGAQVAGSTTDVSKHINLYGGSGYGINVTAARINYVVGGSNNHAFVVGTLDVATINASGLIMGGAITSGNHTISGSISIQNPIGTANVFVGVSAGILNTGSFNTALGASALPANTSGTGNTAVGQAALYTNSTGVSNTAVGLGVLQANTTGNTNTAIGRAALNGNITGASNVALGAYAASSATTINNSIIIGYNTQAQNASGDTNEIVIGYASTGLGSNTTNIGNSSTTLTNVYGNMTITGTLSPAAINPTVVMNAIQPVAASTVVSSASSTISLTLATHNNKIITLTTNTLLNIDWNNTGNGFTCVLINSTGADLTPAILNFTGSFITNSVSAPKITNNGMVTVLCHSPDSGTTKYCRVVGEVTF